jgi:protein ImuA
MGNEPGRTICLEELRRRIACLEGVWRTGSRESISSGCSALDQCLPQSGFRRGSLIEWLSHGGGCGAGTMALLAAEAACSDGGVLAVLDRCGEFCPPAAVRLGIDPEQLIVVHAENAADHDWAMDQLLRSSAVAAALAWPEKLNSRTFRRWQLAAEEGGCLGLLLRPAAAHTEPSWAEVRLLIEPLPVRCATGRLQAVNFPDLEATLLAGKQRHIPNSRRLLRIVVLRCRGATDGRTVDVELDDETHRMYPIAERRLQIAN